MKPEIKQRIEQIKAGQVPDGYKKTKIGVVPLEWKDVHFGDLFITKNRYAEDLDKYPLYSLTIEDGITAKSERYERSHLVKKENAYKVVEPNDFAYNPMNVRFGAVARHKENIPVSVSGYYDIFTTKENADLKFMDNFLVSDRMIKYYNKVSTGSLVEKQRVHYSEFIEFNLPLPSVKEREKIAKILSVQDRIIELYQRKIEELQKMKKIYLSKMFPKKGENAPEWRFSQFNDSWEQRKFGDLGSVAMCKRIFKEQTSTDGDIPFYKIGTFGAEPDAFISRELFKEYREKFQYPNVGDMLISASGTIGRTVEYKGEEAYFQDSNIVWFKHDDRVDNSFLKCIYEIVKWSGIEGSTIKRLYNDNFLKTEFSMPKVAEQQQIGMYFQSLDHLITLHQRKLEENKKYKKALMQLLLTGIVRV